MNGALYMLFFARHPGSQEVGSPVRLNYRKSTVWDQFSSYATKPCKAFLELSVDRSRSIFSFRSNLHRPLGVFTLDLPEACRERLSLEIYVISGSRMTQNPTSPK